MPRVPVPESQKKAQVAAAKAGAAATKKTAQKAEDHTAKKRLYMKKAVSHARAHKAEANRVRAMHQTAVKEGNHFAEPGAKVAFVVRIRGINDLAPKPRKILQLLRLRQIHNGVFVALNKATINMLRKVEPFIAWGYPSEKTVRALVYKRGYLNIKGNRIPISENEVVQEALDTKTKGSVICAEDLVHELFTCGANFSKVAHAFWPFKLTTPNGGLKYKNSHFVEGGDFGCRESLINAFVARML